MTLIKTNLGKMNEACLKFLIKQGVNVKIIGVIEKLLIY
jgi:hypothetical protein